MTNGRGREKAWRCHVSDLDLDLGRYTTNLSLNVNVRGVTMYCVVGAVIDAPSVSVQSITSSEVTLTWQPVVSRSGVAILGYKVYFGQPEKTLLLSGDDHSVVLTDLGKSSAYTQFIVVRCLFNNVLRSSLSYVVLLTEAETLYNIRVLAYVETGEEGKETSVTVTTLPHGAGKQTTLT